MSSTRFQLEISMLPFTFTYIAPSCKHDFPNKELTQLCCPMRHTRFDMLISQKGLSKSLQFFIYSENRSLVNQIRNDTPRPLLLFKRGAICRHVFHPCPTSYVFKLSLCFSIVSDWSFQDFVVINFVIKLRLTMPHFAS